MPASALEYVAQRGEGPAGAWAAHDRQGDRIERHREEIREA